MLTSEWHAGTGMSMCMVVGERQLTIFYPTLGHILVP